MHKTAKVKKQNLAIFTLLGIAVVLGVAIFNQQKLSPSSPAQQVSNPSPVASDPRPLPENLTTDERFILNPPPADASRSALQKHAQTVKKLAKADDSLEIKDCQPNPRVLGLKQGSDFTIKNQDSTKRMIIIDEENIHEVPANGSKTIKASFKYGSGDYGYVCKDVGLVGFLHVAP